MKRFGVSDYVGSIVAFLCRSAKDYRQGVKGFALAVFGLVAAGLLLAGFVTVVQAAADTSTSLASAPNPANFGSSVTFTATVTSGAGTPTGFVEFREGGTLLGTSSLDGSGQAAFSTSSLTVGLHPITAIYLGASGFNGSVSNTINQVVNTASTTNTLLSVPNPSTFGQNVDFTATVTSVAPGTPGGTVTFFDGATNIGSCTLAAATCTFSTSSLTTGTHPITAVYSGGGNFAGSTSNLVNHVVGAAASTTTLSSGTNPSVFGENVTFTTNVTSGAGTPTGTVNFLDGATNIGSCTLAAGTCTFSTALLAVGTHPITAVYAGDTNFATSTSPVVNQVVNQASTTAALTAAPNPSLFGESVTFTANVTAVAPGAGTPTGTVDFLDGATNIGSCILAAGLAPLAPAPLQWGHTLSRRSMRAIPISPPVLPQ